MFNPISHDGIENIRFFENLCKSDPTFYLRDEARIFLERCVSSCSSAVFWVQYQHFLLLIQRRELKEALSMTETLLAESGLPDTTTHYIKIISALALTDLGRFDEALRIMVREYSANLDSDSFGELIKILRIGAASNDQFRELLNKHRSRSELIEMLKILLNMSEELLTKPLLISSERLKELHIGSLPPVTSRLPAVEVLPSTQEKSEDQSFLPESPPIDIYRIPMGSLSFSCRSLGVFDQNGCYIECLSSGIARGPVPEGQGLKLKGTTALISDLFVTSNICHWTYDTLPRIGYIKRSYSGQIDHWIVPSTRGEFVAASVKAFCIEPSSLVSLEENPEITAESLIATTSSAATVHPLRNGWSSNIEFIRSNLMSLARIQDRSAASSRRILISRADVAERVLIGEQELFENLNQSFGFEILSPGKLSFADQIRVFADAEVVVGCHGAGLTNIIFCKPGTLVIEIYPAHYGTRSYSVTAIAANLEYRRIYARDPDNSTSTNADSTPVGELSRFITSGRRNVLIGQEEQKLIVDYVREYLGRIPSPQWRSTITRAVASGEQGIEIDTVPEQFKCSPELWLNKGFSHHHNPVNGMAEINGVKGWLTRGDVSFLYQIARSIPQGGFILEIGSFLGLSAITFANGLLSNGNLHGRVLCVDTWLGSAEHQDIDWIKDGKAYSLFQRNIAEAGVQHMISPLRMPSLYAAPLFSDESLDAIFVDGDHSYEGCMADLIAWWPKCKRNGVFFGHDAGPFPVVDAVNDFAKKNDLLLEIYGEPLHYMWVMSEKRRIEPA